MKAVTAKEEWCAEAYMETDYSAITQSQFEEAVKNYAMFRLTGVGGMIESSVSDADG